MKVTKRLKVFNARLCWQIGLIYTVTITAICESRRCAIADEVNPETGDRTAETLDIAPEIIQDSPVLQRWLKKVPNVLEDIKYDPSFKTRFGLGFTWFPSNDDITGINLTVKDIFIQRTGITIDADYYTAFEGDRLGVGANLNYFLLPLGSYINLAPLVGYRYVQSNDFSTDGINLGLKVMLALSRTGAGDISLTQSFVTPGGNQEIGITAFSAGYGITPRLRLSSDFELQNSPENKDTRIGINLEWLFK